MTCELQRLLFLLQNFFICHLSHALVFYDNWSSLHIASNHAFHECAEYVELDYHLVRDKLQADIIYLLPICSKDQIVDIYTKSLGASLSNDLLTKLGMYDRYFLTYRGNIG